MSGIEKARKRQGKNTKGDSEGKGDRERERRESEEG